jgi:cytoskeletal protein CcmA (bactofilin family)
MPALTVIEAKLGGDRALMPLLLAIMMSALLVATWAVSYARPPSRRAQRTRTGRAAPAGDVMPGQGLSTAAMFRAAPAATSLAHTPTNLTATPEYLEPALQRDIEDRDAPSTQNCSIGPGIEIVGNVFATRPLVISGRIRGDIVAPEVDIRHGGRVQGNVEADRLTVVGTLVGTARVRLLELRESGRLIGEMEAATFAFDHGAEIEAAVRTKRADAEDAGAVSPS